MSYDSIAELIEEVQETLETLESDPTDIESLDFKDSVTKFVEDFGQDSDDLLAALSAIEDEVGTFVPVDGFKAYAESYITDVYGLDDIPSILSANIDWEGVADDLHHEFTLYTINGEDYYVG